MAPFSERQSMVDFTTGGLDLLEATAPDDLGAEPGDGRLSPGQQLRAVTNRLARLLLVLAGVTVQ